mgnify:CR=1 FL=1
MGASIHINGTGSSIIDTVFVCRSTGLYPRHTNGSPDDWAVYLPADHTPGAPNPVPRAVWSTLPAPV